MFTRKFERRVYIAVGVFVLSCTIGVGFGAYVLWPSNLEAGYQPPQPLPFSPLLHAGDMKIPCLYCHSEADRGPHATVPPLSTCMKCHEQVQTKDAAGNLGKNHPQYQRMESELASLKQKLAAETRHITSGFATSRTVGKDRESELRTAIDAQRRKLLDLKRLRDELAVLMRDVDAAQKAYDAVSQRINQTTLESQTTQTNVSVLTPAEAPIEPSFPKLPLNIALAVFLGGLLGVGAALMTEMLDRRIRSVEDLAEMLQLPVLGIIERGKKRRRPTMARTATVTAP